MEEHYRQDDSRVALALEIEKLVRAKTESFQEQNVGADLAYLLIAILEDDGFDAWPHEDSRVIGILRENLPATHPVWRYVKEHKDGDA